MRFGLFDLLMFTASLALGFWGTWGAIPWWRSWFPGQAGFAVLVWLATTVPVGVALFAVVASPLYWALALPPLLLPRCPHCGYLPDRYQISAVGWPRMHAECGSCRQPVDLWWRRPKPADLAPDRPSLLLAWPQAIGRWRQIGPPESPR